MSKLKELIQALCPEGVPYLPIKEIASCYAGATPKTTVKEYWDGGNIPWMSSGEVNKQIITETENFITQAGFDSCSTKMVPANSVVIALAGQGKTRGLVALTKIDLCTNQSLCAIVPNAQMNSSFLYHFLGSQYQKLRTVSSGDGTRGGLNLQMINSYVVPVPPIEVQEEIVKILDRFAEYAAELQAELQARKEQYEYYRNLLLTFNPSACGCGTDDEQEINVTTWGGHSYKIAWKTMGEIARIMNGKDYKHLEKGEIPVYGSGGIMTYINDYIYDGESVLLPRKGSIGKIYYVNNKFWTVDTIYWTKINQKIVKPKFLYYYLKTQNTERKAIKAGAVPSMTQEIYNKIIIPIPPIELQEKIVAILDRFETLVNDLTQGLPAEIAAIKEQYEYYRNKMLI